jgi:hypothetical protein
MRARTVVRRTTTRLVVNRNAATSWSKPIAVSLPYVAGLEDQADAEHPVAGDEPADPDALAGRGRYAEAY